MFKVQEGLVLLEEMPTPGLEGSTQKRMCLKEVMIIGCSIILNNHNYDLLIDCLTFIDDELLL